MARPTSFLERTLEAHFLKLPIFLKSFLLLSPLVHFCEKPFVKQVHIFGYLIFQHEMLHPHSMSFDTTIDTFVLTLQCFSISSLHRYHFNYFDYTNMNIIVCYITFCFNL